jgi:hypothetical protein
VSNVGKTALPGHGLKGEGSYRYDARGNRVTDYGRIVYEGDTLHAKCACGALSAPGISINAAKRWHREHKDSLR